MGPPLLTLSVCIMRKLQSGGEPGLEPRYSDMGYLLFIDLKGRETDNFHLPPQIE